MHKQFPNSKANFQVQFSNFMKLKVLNLSGTITLTMTWDLLLTRDSGEDVVADRSGWGAEQRPRLRALVGGRGGGVVVPEVGVVRGEHGAVTEPLRLYRVASDRQTHPERGQHGVYRQVKKRDVSVALVSTLGSPWTSKQSEQCPLI